MVFKELEIQGFKSFPDKVKITFDAGVTGVVGPNGSGKSNLSDAVRWVLGETSSRQLRAAGKMEDVIFGGTRRRSAMGFASVRLTLDNTGHTLDVDADEVTIGRKYYRSGDSEYTINGQVCRLRDVYELLLDTGIGRDGYSVIGQGRIAEIVAAKSSERREIFEEACGIAKYRYRKTEAERRLAAAGENLERLRDILGELESRVGPLEKESAKAQKSLESLKAMSAPHARVLRDGEKLEISALSLVPGDILLLEAGDIAAADGRILENYSLQVNESALTGESENINKTDRPLDAEELPLGDRLNMVYSGSPVAYGRAVVLVTATGMDTEMGKIAHLMASAQEKETPLQKSLDDFSKKLSILILIICAIVFALGVWRQMGLGQALMFAVALAVAAIPEALSSIVTIGLAIGTQKMAKEHAIITECHHQKAACGGGTWLCFRYLFR